ncbi:MAG TPA: DUF1003 domain-containing protein [Actinoallomurus sp.]|nr:DUF1003 domain-containing protein [Actinoallomurus sp.]
MSTGLDRVRDQRRLGRLDQPREVRLVPRLYYDPEAFGVFSERIARFLGTARFLVYMTGVVLVWFVWNVLVPMTWRFDPYPFIFLTLILSLQASYAAPLILLAQNRQDDRDRVQYEGDRARDERSVSDTEYLTREVASLRMAMSEVATRDWIRDELQHLLKDLEGRRRDG